jgi:hypothetical protein
MNPINFSSGSGRLNANHLNSTDRATHEVWNPFIPTVLGGWNGPYMCKVIGSEQMYGPTGEGELGATFGGRFLYNLDEIMFNTFLDSEGVTMNTRTSTFGRTLGVNLAEIGNTGEDLAEDRIRSGLTAAQLGFFDVLPTPVGSIVPVWTRTVKGLTGVTGSSTYYAFNRAGELYGPC